MKLARKSGSERHKRPISIGKKIAVGIALLVALIVTIPAVYVYQSGGIKQLVFNELNSLSPNIEATVGEAGVEFKSGLIPISIVARDITLKTGDDVLLVPNARVGFALSSLMQGRPNEIALLGLKLDLVRGSDGWATSPSGSLFGEIASRASGTADTNAPASGPVNGVIGFAGLQHIVIAADHLTIAHEDFDDLAPLKLVDFNARITASSDGSLGGTMSASREIANLSAGSVSMRFTGWPGRDGFLADVAMEEFNLADLATYFKPIPASVSQLGKISGQIYGGFGDNGVNRIDADIIARDGNLSLPGSTELGGFDRANLDFTYRRDANLLQISSAEVMLRDSRKLGFAGDVIGVHSPAPSVNGVLSANRLSLASLYNDWPAGVADDFKDNMQDRFSGGAFENARLEVIGSFDRNGRRLVVTHLDVASDFAGVRMNVAGGQYKRLVGTIDGALALRLGNGGQVENVGLELALKDGSVLLADHPVAVPIDNLSIKAGLSDSVLLLDEMAIMFDDGGEITADGALVLLPDWSPEQLRFSLNTKIMDVGLFHAVWPEWVVSTTRRWVDEKITDGVVQNAKLKIVSDFTKDKPALSELTGSLGLVDARLALGGNIPVFEDVDAFITLDKSQADIQFLSAQVDELAVQQGRVMIAPIIGGQPRAIADLNLKGELASAITIANSFGLTKAGGVFDLETIEASGEVEMAIKTGFPVGPKLDRGDVDITVDANVSSGDLRNLPFDAEVANAELVMSFRPEGISVTGSAAIFDVPGNFSFVTDAATGQVEFVGRANPSIQMAEKLATFSGIEIGGEVGAALTLNGDNSFTDLKVALATDMRRASVNVPVLNWAKLPGENGLASLTFGVRDRRIYSLDSIDISLGSLSATGQVVLGEDGSMRGALFERVVWPGNDLRDFIIESGSSGEWKIGTSAKLIDLVPLRRNEGVGEGQPISFDITGERIVIGQGVVLQGQITGNKRADGGGKAKFSGNLLRNNEPMITESELTVVFGEKGDLLNGAGLIGGAETTIAYSAASNKDPTLKLVSKNAGRLLNGLGITDAISSGEIVLTNVFAGDDLAEFDTDIKMTGFNVLEAPRAVKIFSVLGPIGLYKLVEGEGTYFAWGDAQFEKRGSMVRLKNVRAGGDALAVSMVGTYDTNLRQVNISGNLIPANFVNKIAEAVPVLGTILTGLDNSGIVVSQFSMVGDIDDPETSTNAASLVPGLLRDLFSPDWLGRESERILGADNATE
ncbi:AsmA-like C-terminal domain-containing protein [Alphaproteobacteria bacterium]|nr:AsmA-like C-terminal domain-containing protein [Alphaproteobacteria bacterium]